MKRTVLFSLLLTAALTPPVPAAARYYSDHGWYGQPAVTPSGPPSIVFPVQGGASFTDDFGDPRSGGRTHEGNDLMAPKMTPVLAARGGRITYAPMAEPSYGYMITISGDDGYEYDYLHVNNDTPGTDDGNGGPQYAYAPGIKDGVQVVQGQHIAWVGDSGNAEGTASHLHFEIRLPDDTPIDPYVYLNAALQIFTYDAAAVTAASQTINSDKGLIVTASKNIYCVPGSLIRTPTDTSVYYCGSDGKRYVFPNVKTYATWYGDYSAVQMVSGAEMAMIPLGGNVTYRPGVRLIKIQTDPKVYAVDRNGVLRWLTTAEVAVKHYGAAWARYIDDVPDAFFTNYRIGEPVNN